MRIRLSQIPPEGREYSFTLGDSSELDEVFYSQVPFGKTFGISFQIIPLDRKGFFSIQGRLEWQGDELCSRCGETYPEKPAVVFSDVLLPEEWDENRFHSGGHQGVFSQTEIQEKGDSYTYQEDSFLLDQFLVEKWALEKPISPAPSWIEGEDRCSFCGLRGKDLVTLYQSSSSGRNSPQDQLEPFQGIFGHLETSFPPKNLSKKSGEKKK